MAAMEVYHLDLHSKELSMSSYSIANKPPAFATMGFTQRSHPDHALRRPLLCLTTAECLQAGSFYPTVMPQRSALCSMALCQPSWDGLRAARMERLILPNPPVSILSFLFVSVQLTSQSQCSLPPPAFSPLCSPLIFSLINLLHT